jgi:hypothetical protein
MSSDLVAAAPAVQVEAKAGSVQMLNHARLRIALHCLQSGSARPGRTHGIGSSDLGDRMERTYLWSGLQRARPI